MAWPDLMPYTAGAFALFGLGSLPAAQFLPAARLDGGDVHAVPHDQRAHPQVVLHGSIWDDADAKARELVESDGLTYVHPFDDLHVRRAANYVTDKAALIRVIGGEVNAELEHQTAEDTTIGGDQPMGQRGAVKADSVGRSVRS